MSQARTFVEWLEGVGIGALPDPLSPLVAGILGSAIVLTIVLLNAAVAGPWLKRKVMADFWEKIGPNRMGPYGLLIIPADVIRLLSKELIIPESVDRPAFDLAPILLTATALFGFAVIPLGTIFGIPLQIADPEIGIAFVFAVASISSLGLVMGGYASNNKYSMLGGLRAVAQNLAYEIPLIITAASVVLLAGSLRPSEVVAAQEATMLTLGPIAIPAWFAFVNPFAFVLFLAANLAEVGRNPFDTPEAPTEIVAGWQTEYSSVYFVLAYLSEFLHIFLGGAIVATLFLGGPAGPILPGAIWMGIKIWAVFIFTQWARSAVPRIRIDQLIEIGWKGMLVLSFLNLVLTAVLVGLFV